MPIGTAIREKISGWFFGKKNPLVAVFNESASLLYAAFPERLDKLVVLVTPLEQPVYISPDIAKHLSKNIVAVKKAVGERADYIYLNHANGVTNYRYPLAEDTVKMIAMKEHPSGSFSLRWTKEMTLIRTFDHEMGHLVVKNGDPSFTIDCQHLAECAADAYATLRHIQRFGRDTDFFEYNNKAFIVVQESYPIHYTNAVLQKVKQLSEETDISRLSLRETAELAATIAEEYHLPEKTLEKLSSAFIPVQEALNKSGWDENVLKECVNVMRENENDPDIYQAGKQILSYPSFKKYINEMERFWQGAFDWMARHEKESGILLEPLRQKSVMPSKDCHPERM